MVILPQGGGDFPETGNWTQNGHRRSVPKQDSQLDGTLHKKGLQSYEYRLIIQLDLPAMPLCALASAA